MWIITGFQITFVSIIMLIFIFIVIPKPIRRIIKHFYKKELPRPAIVGHILNSGVRKFLQPPKSVIDALDVKKGMTILEIGAGGGTYTFEAARMIETGTIYATDVSEGMMKALKENVKKSKLNNIKVEYADVYKLPYPNEMFDRIFMVTVTGELHDKLLAFREVYRVLKSNGKFVVGEFLVDADYPLKRSVKKWAKDVGFRYLASRDRIMHYTVIFSK